MPQAYLSALSEQDETARWAGSIHRAASRRRRILVGEVAGAIGGVAVTGADLEDDSRGLLFLMYVHPEHWGHGLGHALMTACQDALLEDRFEAAVLWVLEENTRARAFYERHGWQADGARTVDDYGGAALPALRYQSRLVPA
ncbi:MAG: GNAT family N-acetyltransferase [Dehalococcoidia bacterium]|nr:GNAT family N-acetyltransferase [Dehalococcoidia bacterium]